ncbi:chromosomal replication initiator protein DnaA [candidate division KSB1 bacterium]|nr:chromosomal replication initiator protein DnaA [candidate division KSB1 bacterium]
MVQEFEDVWSKCLSMIKTRIPDQTFTTWFKPIVPLKLDNSTLTVQLPSQFFYEFIDNHYKKLISEALTDVINDNASIDFIVNPNKKSNDERILIDHEKTNTTEVEGNHFNLSNRYRFENFVEGNNNQFARAAAFAVAQLPGKTAFNPLVIYGGVGLGKTHLIQAIGNHVMKEFVGKRVLYTSSEKFTIEFIESIQRNSTTEFSNLYRNVDVLIVDDVHFFIHKERTQEEFFHTFNTLYQNGKQIVLSSDRPPKELMGMEDRLLSRFQSGLVVDIQPPDLETRIAILQRKAEENSIEISNDIIELFATNIVSNIRELEGALIRLLARSSLDGKDITLDLAKSVLKDLKLGPKRNLTVETIQRITCDYYSIPEDLIRAKTRKQEVAFARQVAMYLVKKHTNHPFKTIGLHFGGRDHSTVIHAVNTIEHAIKTNSAVREDIFNLERKIEIASV